MSYPLHLLPTVAWGCPERQPFLPVFGIHTIVLNPGPFNTPFKIQELNEQKDALDLLYIQNNNKLNLFVCVLIHLLCVLASSGCCEL